MTYKKHLVFMPVFLVQAFFSISLNAATEPATEVFTPAFSYSCSTEYNWRTQANASGLQAPSFNATIDMCADYRRPDGFVDGHQCVHTYSFSIESQATSHKYGILRVSTNGTCSSGTYELTDFWAQTTHATNIPNGTLSSYECNNPEFPTLIEGNLCESIPTCDNSESVFSSTSSSDQICVTDGASGLSCGYASVKDGYGANSGNFVPVGYACECADMPGGECETGVEPPFPDDSDCAAFGTQTWCASDSSQCEPSADGGIPCANCGVVNNTYMCAVADAPKAERCQSGSGRSECEGVPDDWCPVGYVCPDLDQSNPDTSDTAEQDQPACTANDTRDECQGVADGQSPIKSEETAQLEQSNALLKGINDKLDQSNQSTNDTNGLLNQLLDGQFNDEDEAAGNSAIEAAQSIASGKFSDELNDRSAEAGLIAKESTLIGTITGSISGKLVPSATCVDMPLSIPNSSQTLNIPLCDISAYVRPILAWVFMIAGVIYIRREIYGALKEVRA